MSAARKHLTYIVHGARADRPELRQMVSWVRQRGHAVDVRVTWDAGEGEWLTAQARGGKPADGAFVSSCLIDPDDPARFALDRVRHLAEIVHSGPA